MSKHMSKPKRAALFKVVCLSLFTGSASFASRPTVHSALHLNEQAFPSAPIRSGLNPLRMAGTPATAPSSMPRISPEEEKKLLRLAVERRRIEQLESELASKSPTRELPFLYARAQAAGYGEDLEAYEDAKYDGQKAREMLVTKNMGLVHFCVNKIMEKRSGKRLNSLSREDLVQEGSIGLARAVDKWNPAIGGKFSTYAVYWIRAAVLRCIAERDDLLRVPSHVSQAITNINKAAKRLGLDLDSTGTSASWKQAKEAKRLAEEAGLSERNFEEAMKVRRRRYSGGYIAFESWMQNGEDLHSDVPTELGERQLSSLETEHLRTTLSQFLRPKEMEALSWRYGLLEDSGSNVETAQEKANRYLSEAEAELFGKETVENSRSARIPAKGRFGEAMTFNEVGKKMHVSAEYTRRLCHAALAKLRNAADDGLLESALLF